jgi:hypothetical protein
MRWNMVAPLDVVAGPMVRLPTHRNHTSFLGLP